MNKERIISLLDSFTQEEKDLNLIEAVKKRNVKMVELWLAAGANPTAYNGYAMNRAVTYGYREIIEKLKVRN